MKGESVKSISFEEEIRIKKEIQTILSNPHISDEVKKASLEFLSSKFTYSSFINVVEEPEQNLFPTSQRIILNNLLAFANMKEGNQLILTTHSPYIINYLSIAIQGDYLKGKIDAHTKITNVLKSLHLPSLSTNPCWHRVLFTAQSHSNNTHECQASVCS